MPRKRKSNLSQSSNKARAMKVARLNETFQQTELRRLEHCSNTNGHGGSIVGEQYKGIPKSKNKEKENSKRVKGKSFPNRNWQESFHYPPPMESPYPVLATGSRNEKKVARFGHSCSFLTLWHHRPPTQPFVNKYINGDRYRAVITNFFIHELNNHDVQELWFQQDGATCHTARATIDLLKDTLGDRLISRFGPVNWPPRSCDLTPLDYFLWGYVKSLVYADKRQMLDHLEDNIRRVIADMRPQMLEKVIENWTSRLDYIRASRGSPMPEIIFKM
ncbi:uncharacterized protein TNCV_3616161 [Trichonephila clavipes]|nr:uncharacterized protein TNCV_3616161 [Trichonephila clavipes]